MRVVEIIKKKRQGEVLTKDLINQMVQGYIDNSIPDYQMSAFLMAICIKGMNEEETAFLTDIMLNSGDVITHSCHNPIIDKHSTGGVGDKISIPLAPAAAACGLSVPMIAGRGLGHTGGTLDKLEAIPGFRASLSVAEYKQQVKDIGCVIMGQTNNIAPADKKIYALRDVSGCVESIPLICSSIMSKKLAEGINGLVLDVKFGSGAFMKDIASAKELASAMVKIGSLMNKHITVCLTNMDQPLGRFIGNSLEIIESIDILQAKGPKDSTEITIELGAEMLLLAKTVTNLEEGRQKIAQALKDQSAFNKFVQMIKAQGGDTDYIINPHKFTQASQKIVINAHKKGFISSMDCEALGLASCLLGGGRNNLTDIIDMSVGIEMHKKVGDEVCLDEPILTLHANEKGLKEAINKATNAINIQNTMTNKPKLCQERISTL